MGRMGAIASLRDRVRAERFPIGVRGPKGAFVSAVVDVIATVKRPVVVVAPGETEAQAIAEDLDVFGLRTVRIPSLGVRPYASPSTSSVVWGERMHGMVELAIGRADAVVVDGRSVLLPVPDRSDLLAVCRVIHIGDALDPIELAHHLAEAGYWRVPRVTVHGEFAIRGEVVDVFVPGQPEAFRIVLDFDRVDSLRRFDPIDQSSVSDEKTIEITPHRETVMPATGTLIDLAPAGAVTVWVDMARVRGGWGALRDEYHAEFRARRDEGLSNPDDSIIDAHVFEERWEQRSIVIETLADASDTSAIRVACDPPRSFFGNISYLKEELGALTRNGSHVFVLSDTEAQQKRIAHLLDELGVNVLLGRISAGFALPDAGLIVIQEDEIFGRRKRRPASTRSARSAPIDTFVELEEGDHVVHINYGIGRFLGIQRLRAAENERDYIKLEYADAETVFIPIEQVNLVQRYIGSGGDAPRLDRIGGKSWERRKGAVRRNVEDLADRLIALYSRRRSARGFAFPEDTEWQLDFEASFPWEETADQLTCIDEIKRDMERPEPMDRLICGDVGYGKTEVALRAVFKAVASGKQVAFLAPTTILVEQHYERMNERFERFPVKIAMLSRFVPRSEQRETLAKLKTGDVDIVVGTHRLLQNDVAFRDLGLLVIDEEQRFGVKAKERLKEVKTNIDCLTLTATPIPRTLHMSLLKIRDMSLLTTPPRNRRPIETIVAEFSEEAVERAIRREIERGGQVFFLHNRVETLQEVRRFVEALVPEALVDVAHGQMGAQELEDVMYRFVHDGFHVLVATTIIENGIDIPNVNTIIIDRADLYGVSQLYQLRGRVGRSDRVAWAYLLYPEERALTEIAMKRLQIISDFTELGSGFKIALKDLEVRGAGNLLGSQQSGDIVSVGFDLYLRLLDEAIRERSEGGTAVEEEVYLELEYSGYIPDSYISDMMEKMEVYKKIAGAQSDADIDGVVAEVTDRFGPMPDEVQSLLALAEIRVLGRALHLVAMRERRGVLEIEFGNVASVSVERVLALISGSQGRVRLDPRRPNVLLLDTGSVGLKEKSEFIRGRLAQLL